MQVLNIAPSRNQPKIALVDRKIALIDRKIALIYLKIALIGRKIALIDRKIALMYRKIAALLKSFPHATDDNETADDKLMQILDIVVGKTLQTDRHVTALMH